MQPTIAIARRELASLYYSPIAYVVMGIFGMGTTLIFMLGFGPGLPATLRGAYDGVVWLMVFLVPAISMRLISEEFRSGSIEPLVTAPVSDAQVVVGKWLGAMGFFVSLLIPLLLLLGVLEIFASPDYGPVLTGALGVLLVGGLYLAIGTFASALNQNQIIAFLITVFIICFFTVAMNFLPQASFMPAHLRDVMFFLNVNAQFEDFNKGLIDTSKLTYFLSGIAFFLFLAVKVLESRRWR